MSHRQARLHQAGARSNPVHDAPLLSPIDKITIGYCVWIILYMLAGVLLQRKVVTPQFYLAWYVSFITGIVFMAWGERHLGPYMHPILLKVLQFLRSIYPVFLFTFFYTWLHAVNLIVFDDWLDPFFQRLDFQIFGYYPSLEWGGRFGHWALQELFHFAYFFYYPMIGGLPTYLYLKDKKAFNELIFTLSFVFYTCYFIYSLLPVVGARFDPMALALTEQYRGGPFTHVMAFIYNHSAHWGGAFPSSHIAVSLILTLSALKHARKLGYMFAVITFFLAIATVYCHYHWFVDAVAGIFAGILGYFLAGFLRSKLQHEAT